MICVHKNIGGECFDAGGGGMVVVVNGGVVMVGL